jgi:AbrB family looped-hinge helix DNA binding protein
MHSHRVQGFNFVTYPWYLWGEERGSFSEDATVAVGKEGRITLPAHFRQILELKEGSHLVIDVDLEHQWLRLRPAVTVPREEAWAYTSQHLAQLTRALAELAQGRSSPVSEEEVAELLQDDDRVSKDARESE